MGRVNSHLLVTPQRGALAPLAAGLLMLFRRRGWF
jgi:hypothetical protein